MYSKINHGAPFPMELPLWFIKLFTKRNDVVLDAFIGSGTTAITTIAMKRKYLGIEINKEYHKTAIRNIEEIHNEV